MRLTVDGQLVWQGLTPRSFGYVTLNFPATPGCNLKIELTAPFRVGDALSRITEIGGSSDVKTMDGKGALSIVEAGFYE